VEGELVAEAAEREVVVPAVVAGVEDGLVEGPLTAPVAGAHLEADLVAPADKPFEPAPGAVVVRQRGASDPCADDGTGGRGEGRRSDDEDGQKREENGAAHCRLLRALQNQPPVLQGVFPNSVKEKGQ